MVKSFDISMNTLVRGYPEKEFPDTCWSLGFLILKFNLTDFFDKKLNKPVFEYMLNSNYLSLVYAKDLR